MLNQGSGRAAQPSGEPNQQLTTAIQASQQDSGPTTLRITTREVLIDVIALQGRGLPVLDLKTSDLQVSETSVSLDPDSTSRHQRPLDPTPARRGTITSLRLLDPNAPQASGDDAQSGFQITESCLERSTVHYQLAFHPGPDGWRSGYHSISISTTRPGVKLFYRHQYYLGLTEPPARPPVIQGATLEKLLLQAACQYPATPPSILLRAKLVDTGRSDVLRYSVAIDANSLSYLTLDRNAPTSETAIGRRVGLDYGVCTFDSRGLPINFFHAHLDKVLTPDEYTRALDGGFPHILEFPTPDHIAVARFVARDSQTGNLGMIDVQYRQPAKFEPIDQSQTNDSVSLAAATKTNLEVIERPLPDPSVYRGPALIPSYLQGPVGSYGSIVPTPRSFCGDVYELPHRFAKLPDFRGLDPIGSLYTSVLDVPNQIFSNTTGIPGVTPRTDLFGIDYHDDLWITIPGEYTFLILSDDGAIVRIDDKELINVDGIHPATAGSGAVHLSAGRHALEVKYYQGLPAGVALELWVKPPGAHSWTLFDTNDYSLPDSGTASQVPH